MLVLMYWFLPASAESHRVQGFSAFALHFLPTSTGVAALLECNGVLLGDRSCTAVGLIWYHHLPWPGRRLVVFFVPGQPHPGVDQFSFEIFDGSGPGTQFVPQGLVFRAEFLVLGHQPRQIDAPDVRHGILQEGHLVRQRLALFLQRRGLFRGGRPRFCRLPQELVAVFQVRKLLPGLVFQLVDLRTEPLVFGPEGFQHGGLALRRRRDGLLVALDDPVQPAPQEPGLLFEVRRSPHAAGAARRLVAAVAVLFLSGPGGVLAPRGSGLLLSSLYRRRVPVGDKGTVAAGKDGLGKIIKLHGGGVGGGVGGAGGVASAAVPLWIEYQPSLLIEYRRWGHHREQTRIDALGLPGGDNRVFYRTIAVHHCPAKNVCVHADRGRKKKKGRDEATGIGHTGGGERGLDESELIRTEPRW